MAVSPHDVPRRQAGQQSTGGEVDDAGQPGLLSAAHIRDLAERLGIRPTKQWGQNFVIDPNTIRRIVGLAELCGEEHVLEVGPGLGSLTLGLLDEAARVTAVEIDPVLSGQLPKTVRLLRPESRKNLNVVQQDALKIGVSSRASHAVAGRTSRPVTDGVAPGEQAPGAAVQNESSKGSRRALSWQDARASLGEPEVLVANLPYNVAVPVVLHLLEVLPSLTKGLVMVQEEVADRLCAGPGSKTYGVPSVKAAWDTRMRKAGVVGKKVFWPEPRISSGLVRFDRHEPVAQDVSRHEVYMVIDAAFAQRRKTLRAALSGLAGSSVAAEQALRTAGIDPQVRGETLPIQSYAAIARALRQGTVETPGVTPGA